MKHRYFYIPLMLLAAASCSIVLEEPAVQEPIEEPSIERGGFDIVVNARIPDESADAQTKVTISQVDDTHYNMNWSATGETATLIESRQKDWQILPYSSTSAKLTGGSMAFSFEAIAPQGDQDWATGKGFGYDIIYPGTAYVSKSSMTATLSLPATQTPLADSPDAAASLLYGRAGVFETQPTTALNAEFSHLAAYGKMALIGIPAGESITSIDITAADYNIAGNLTYNTWSQAVVYTATEEHTITLNGTNLTANPAGFDVWFACKPFTLAAGSTLVVSITTSANVYTCVLKAKADMEFEAGVVTSFPATPNRYVVTFESNGGSVVAPAMVKSGQTVAQPAAPTKVENLSQGLYLGEVDPDNCNAAFGGWYTDAGCTEEYNFSTAVTSNLTLYAKWTEHELIDTAPNAAASNNTIVHESINYVNAQEIDSETHYTLVLTSDVRFYGGVSNLNKANAVLHFVGKESERKIWTSANYMNVLGVNGGRLVLGKNLHIYSSDLANHTVITINDSGQVVMEDGCRLSGSAGCTATGVVVKINSSTSSFTMNGGEICNNKGLGNATRQGIIDNANGTFTMNGGIISGNSVTSDSDAAHLCGGVLHNGWTWDGHRTYKYGGEIKDNVAGRTVTSSTGTMGQQVLIAGGAKKKIDSNVGAAQNLNFDSNGAAPWETAIVQ